MNSSYIYSPRVSLAFLFYEVSHLVNCALVIYDQFFQCSVFEDLILTTFVIFVPGICFMSNELVRTFVFVFMLLIFYVLDIVLE